MLFFVCLFVCSSADVHAEIETRFNEIVYERFNILHTELKFELSIDFKKKFMQVIRDRLTRLEYGSFCEPEDFPGYRIKQSSSL